MFDDQWDATMRVETPRAGVSPVAAENVPAARGGEASRTLEGRVLKKVLGSYDVDVGGRLVRCSVSSKLRKQLVFPTADPASVRRRVVEVDEIEAVVPVAIGDAVRFVAADGGTGMIVEVLPRHNKLVRRAAGTKRLEQVIVANVDQVVPVFAAAQPEPKWALLDRYLVAAEDQGLPARICLTKLDLVVRSDLDPELAVYERAGYPVLRTSVVTGEGIDALRDLLRDRVTVFIGKSGVGKTSLLNAIEPGLGLRVNAVSASTGKGKHTTTHLEMFGLTLGGAVVDTPGMREFGLWDVPSSDLDRLFPEMRPFLGACRFGASCTHENEPGCAIKEAVVEGAIAARRYQSYLRLREG